MECIAEHLEALPVALQCDVVLPVANHLHYVVEPEDGVFVVSCYAWFAAVFFLHALSREIECDAGVYYIGKDGSRNDV